MWRQQQHGENYPINERAAKRGFPIQYCDDQREQGNEHQQWHTPRPFTHQCFTSDDKTDCC